MFLFSCDLRALIEENARIIREGLEMKIKVKCVLKTENEGRTFRIERIESVSGDGTFDRDAIIQRLEMKLI